MSKQRKRNKGDSKVIMSVSRLTSFVVNEKKKDFMFYLEIRYTSLMGTPQ